MKRLTGAQFVAILVIAVLVVMLFQLLRGGRRELVIDRATSAEAVRALLSDRDRAAIHAKLDSYLGAVHRAYEEKRWSDHARHTIALLLYANSFPIFYVDSYVDPLVERVRADGLDPYLSLYVDLGRRLQCASVPSALRRYRQLARQFASSAETGAAPTAPAVFLRERCEVSSPHRVLSSNVGWTVAAIVFSEFGANLLANSRGELSELLQVAQDAAEAPICSGETIDEAHGAPLTASLAIGRALSAGMSEPTEKVFCKSANDIRANGVAGFDKACVAAMTQIAGNGGFPRQRTSLDELGLFTSYLACKERAFDSSRQTSPFYDQMSTHFYGGDSGGWHKVSEHDGVTEWARDWSENVWSSKKVDSGNPDNVHSTTEHEVWPGKDGAVIGSSVEYNYDEGAKHEYEDFHTPNGQFEHVKDCDLGGDHCTESYKQWGPDGASRSISSEDYDAEKKEYFPPFCCVRPGPDDALSPCDRILAGSRPPITPPDIGALIQTDPYEFEKSGLQSLAACLENFDEQRACRTQLLCVDEVVGADCKCKSLGSPLGPTSQCPYIQCPADAIVAHCMCQGQGGGLLPGLGGPLVQPGGPRLPFGP